MDKNTLIIISALLAIMPIVSYLLQSYCCGLEHKKRLFGKYIPVAFLDWVFVPFNILWIFVVSLNYYIIGIFVVVLIANLIFMKLWERVHIKERNPLDLYDIKKKRITSAGIVHLIYAQIQATLIFSFLLFSVTNVLTYFGMLFLLIYLIGMPISSKIIHGKLIREDGFLFVLGILLFLAKLYWMVFL